MRYLLLFLFLLPVASMLYIRHSSMSVERWHVDPATAPRPGTPNAYLLRDIDGDAPAAMLAAPPEAVAAALDRVAATAPRVTRLAGSAAGGHVTYVQRSRIMGYPDAMSIRLSPVGDGTRIEIFSRSRFGYSDAGVNAARVARWMARLEDALGS
jgi:uncharacterized protein (DUF1499 family)